ncbi:exonuclease domain-containing protein [Paenibacillus gansuensis]|uniref:Exonuclease domain-containing protein n=1 Tax=Paenibacillus gansuensis TaxID=306542 RepID=A0ABW5P949_9BACL
MQAVVYDLELVKRFRKGQLSEIVEIGACKVDLATKTITDDFQVYILPKSGHVSKSTRKFIKMTEADVQSAVPFEEGVKRFASWLGTDYYLCSWGRDDRLHMVNQCVRTKIPLDWFVNYNDVQQQISRLMNDKLKQQLGLKDALDIAGIVPTGQAHRGIDDAINTAELLIRFSDKLTLQKNEITKKEIEAEYLKYKRSRMLHKRAQAGASPAP